MHRAEMRIARQAITRGRNSVVHGAGRSWARKDVAGPPRSLPPLPRTTRAPKLFAPPAAGPAVTTRTWPMLGSRRAGRLVSRRLVTGGMSPGVSRTVTLWLRRLVIIEIGNGDARQPLLDRPLDRTNVGFFFG